MGLFSRNPFVWEIRVRQEVLEDEMARLREIPYSLWKTLLHHPVSKRVKGRDERTYALRVEAALAPDGSGDIRVSLQLTRGRLFPRGHMEQHFYITPANTFRDQ